MNISDLFRVYLKSCLNNLEKKFLKDHKKNFETLNKNYLIKFYATLQNLT